MQNENRGEGVSENSFVLFSISALCYFKHQSVLGFHTGSDKSPSRAGMQSIDWLNSEGLKMKVCGSLGKSKS